MKFLHRLGYYLGGFALGIIILAFFFQNKKTSCAYGPTARTLKNINLKEQKFAPETLVFLENSEIDTSDIRKILKYGDIDFGRSQTEIDSCKIYIITGESELAAYEVAVQNCSKVATVLKIKKTTD